MEFPPRAGTISPTGVVGFNNGSPSEPETINYVRAYWNPTPGPVRIEVQLDPSFFRGVFAQPEGLNCRCGHAKIGHRLQLAHASRCSECGEVCDCQ
jgi:hypothetical protein